MTGFAPALKEAVLDYTYDEQVQPHAVKQINLDGAAALDYNYDLNGNLQTGPDLTDPAVVADRSITFNADNMPVGITHSALGTTGIAYDGEGRRVAKSGSGGTTYYVNQYFEIQNGVETKYIFAGSRRIAKKVASAVYYFHADHLGSARVMTDQNESEVHRSGYAPFGLERGQ